MKIVSIGFKTSYYPQSAAPLKSEDTTISKECVAKINKIIEDREYKLLTGKDRESSSNSKQNSQSITDGLSGAIKIVQEHKKREKELIREIVVLLMLELSTQENLGIQE